MVSANVSIITDTAKTVTEQTVTDYSVGVFTHITGDWLQHSQVRIYPATYADIVDDTGNPASSLRLLLTDASSADIAVIIPALSTATVVSTSGPPIILTQPQDLTVIQGTAAGFSVTVPSDTVVAFQWQKTTTNINGATHISLVIPSAQLSDAGPYRVICTNASGSVISNYGTLTVTTAPASGGGGSEGAGGSGGGGSGGSGVKLV